MGQQWPEDNTEAIHGLQESSENRYEAWLDSV